jgi:spermidine/putrescine transport system substrate-binding protein
MNPMSRRQLLSLAATAGPAAFLAACGSSTKAAPKSSTATTAGAAKPATTAAAAKPATTAAAKAATTAAASAAAVKGTVNFLNFTGWAGKTTYADFAKAFPGATVNEIAWVSADDTVTKAKGRAGDIDVVLVDGTTFPRLSALGVLADLGDLPNLKFVSPQYKGNSWDATNKQFAPTDHGRTGIIYRKDLVTKAPTSWADFYALAPSLTGKVAMLDYKLSVMANTLKMLGKPPSSKDPADIEAVLEVLKKVKPHLRAISTEVGKAVASGDAAMAMIDAYDAQQAINANPNIVWVDPSEGQVGYLEGLAVLKGPREDVSKALVNFFLEQKNYAAFINNVTSPYVQADNADIDAALKSSKVINPDADVVKRFSYHQFLGEAQPIWDKAWDTFKAA